MEITWILLGIKIFQTYVPPSPWGGKKLEGMEKGLIKVFEVEEYYNLVQLEEGTKESCHPRRMGEKKTYSFYLSLLLPSYYSLFIKPSYIYVFYKKNMLCPQKNSLKNYL